MCCVARRWLRSRAVQLLGAQAAAGEKLLVRAKKLLAEVPLVDGHNDLPWAMRENAWYDFGKFDIRVRPAQADDRHPAAAPAALGGQFWSVYVPVDAAGPERRHRHARADRRRPRACSGRYPDAFELARTADDVERIFKQGKIASMIGMEGGHSIDNSLAHAAHVLRSSAPAT